jgi:hypothetical protein
VLPEWLQNLINGATSTTVTGGSLAVFSYFLLTAGKIYTKGQVERLNLEHDKALELQKSQYESRISEIVTLKNESRQIVVDQLTQALTDKATLQNALNIERAAKDAIASKVMDEIVPLVQVTNKHLDGIEELAKGGDPST